MSFTRPSLAYLILLAPLLLASDCGGFDESDFRNPVGPSPFITLQAGAGFTTVGGQHRLPADGVSRGLLIARISADSTQRVIVFTTSAGSLLGGSPSAATTAEVTAVGGEATIELRSSQQVEPARVQATVKDRTDVSSSIEVQFVRPDVSSLIRFTQSPASAPADGRSVSFFEVEISPSIAEAERTVSFQTSVGSFDPEVADRAREVAVGVGSAARIGLYSPEEITQGELSATVTNTTITAPIRFTRALPDAILLELDKLTVRNTADDEITVTVRLLRDLGTVTDGTIVTLRAEQGGAAFGLFRGDQQSTDGQATVRFTPAGDGVPGDARMVIGAQGTGVTATADFEVVAD